MYSFTLVIITKPLSVTDCSASIMKFATKNDRKIE